MTTGERVGLIAAVTFAALACIGLGIQFFTDDDTSFDIGMIVVLAASALAGIALAFESDVMSDFNDPARSQRKSGKLLSALKQTLIVVSVELVLGEVLFAIALASGASDDWTMVFAPLFIGVLFGGMACLLGILIGVMVVWPIITLVGLTSRRRRGRPASALAAPFSALLLTLVTFATLGTLGSNPPDFLGTINGRGLAQIVYLYVNYSGDPAHQAMAWIARFLGAVIVLEIIWLRHVALHRKGQHIGDAVAPK
jgi:hypothetical protein